MRNNSRSLIAHGILVILAGVIFLGTETQPLLGQQAQPTIDLTGVWKYMDGSILRISHDTRTRSVTAEFPRAYSCPNGYATISRLFDGQLDGAKLTGTWTACHDKALVDVCHKEPTATGDFSATITRGEVTGKFYLPYFTWTGECQGLTQSTTVDPYLPLSLTRVECGEN